jgi:hypothetical protein
MLPPPRWAVAVCDFDVSDFSESGFGSNVVNAEKAIGPPNQGWWFRLAPSSARILSIGEYVRGIFMFRVSKGMMRVRYGVC